MFHVNYGRVDLIKDDKEREIFLKWKYRIGGEKWSQACNLLKV